MIEEFVNNQIKSHSEKYVINFSEAIINEIIDYVKSGVYAFQIIYDEKFFAIIVKPLDWTKTIQNSQSDIHHGQSLWSYDGGAQFKYSQWETLKLDIGLIRELKLNGLLVKC